jgi:hypothetical protein
MPSIALYAYNYKLYDASIVPRLAIDILKLLKIKVGMEIALLSTYAI